MRGRLMRLFTVEQHQEILGSHSNNVEAAKAYTLAGKQEISHQLVRYWRRIFLDNDGNLSKTDRELCEMRKFIKPQPDDDIGELQIPAIAKSILVIPDQHIPYHHRHMLPFLVEVKKAFQPDVVVNLGDEVDHHALSFHDSDPNLDSAGMELEKARPVLAALEAMFPNVLVCHSNHGSMAYRRAKAHGIPVQYLKKYREILFEPGRGKGWSWAEAWRLNTPLGHVLFKHQSSGIVGDAAHNQANLVVGHSHGNFSIEYAASSAHLYYGMYCGCLVDKDSLAFAYGKHAKNKPVLGCGVILNGRPMLIPMVLKRNGDWVGHL